MFNMAEHVLSRATELAQKTALTVIRPDGVDTWSYGRLQAAVLGAASGFRALGLSGGDRILMRLGNSPEFPICYLGAIAAGFVPVPTSAQLTQSEIDHIATIIKPALVVSALGITTPADTPEMITDKDLRGYYHLPPSKYERGDPNRPAYIVFTSGTSGKPRAVVHAHRAVWARKLMWDGWYGLTENDRLMHAGAFNWTYTLGTGLIDPWSVGATAQIVDQSFDKSEIATLLAAHHTTIFAAAPGVFRQILKHPMPPLPDLRHTLSAGEKMGPQVHKAWAEATGRTVYEAFGMSEISTFISGSPTRAAPNEALGYAQTGRRIALMGDNGPVDIGETGMIAVHRDDAGLMLGYLDAPEETALKFTDDWFLTGDMARADADGVLYYEGRSDDMMNAGGFRVSPIEVEAALASHPDMSEVAACEVTVKADTTVIAAFYTSVTPLNDDELSAFAASRLARYKCPRLYIHRAELLRGANNKLLRKAMRREWETEHGQT